MRRADLALRCHPRRPQVGKGEPIPVLVEIGNEDDAPIRLLAMSLPWVYHHAAWFEVVHGGAFENQRWVLDPPTVPDVLVEGHGTASGEVDLARYLGSGDQSISDVPGTYVLRCHVTVVASEPDGEGTDAIRVGLDSDEFTVIVR